MTGAAEGMGEAAGDGDVLSEPSCRLCGGESRPGETRLEVAVCPRPDGVDREGGGVLGRATGGAGEGGWLGGFVRERFRRDGEDLGSDGDWRCAFLPRLDERRFCLTDGGEI